MQKRSSVSITDPRLDPARVQIGAQPIIWSNDDFKELGGEISLDRCLAEMKEAGYAGTELGHKFPTDAAALKAVTEKYGLQVVSGWHSSYLLSRSLKEERSEFVRHVNLLAEVGSRVAIVAECTGRTYNRPEIPLGRDSCKEVMDAPGRTRLFEGLKAFSDIAGEKGLKVAYHPHMGTVIESRDDIARLMDAVGSKAIWLLADTGHLTYAGIDPLSVFQNYRSRIAHVHLKNVRPDVMKDSVSRRLPFKEAVERGVFTVPGNGGIDFAPFFRILAEEGFSGWLVVEAEQDPAKAPPLEYAVKARQYIRQNAGL